MISINDISPEEARAELQRREDARAELQRRHPQEQYSWIEQQKSPGLAERLGFTGGKPQGIGDIFSQSINEAATSPGMNFIKGGEEAYGRALSAGQFPRQPLGEGTAYELGKGAGTIGSYLQGGGLAGLASKAIAASPHIAEMAPIISKTFQALEQSPVAQRLIGSAGYGADVNPEDRLKGALLSAGTQGAFDVLGLPFKAAKPIAELFNPIKSAEKELGNIKNSYMASELKQQQAYKPFNEIAGLHKLENPKNYLGSLEINKEYLTPKIKQLHNTFSKDPTLANAHKLQSQMITDIKVLSKKPSDAATIDKIQGLEEMRDSLKQDIIRRVENIDKNIAEKYKEGAKIHKEEIRPYLSNPELANLVEGEIEEISPKDIISAIKPSKVKNELPKEHYLREALKNMQSKANKGAAAQYALPMIAGGAAGQFLHPGLAGIGGGLAAGALGGLGGTKFAEFIQNPEIQKLLERLSGPTRKVISGARTGAQGYINTGS